MNYQCCHDLCKRGINVLIYAFIIVIAATAVTWSCYKLDYRNERNAVYSLVKEAVMMNNDYQYDQMFYDRAWKVGIVGDYRIEWEVILDDDKANLVRAFKKKHDSGCNGITANMYDGNMARFTVEANLVYQY